MPYKDKEAAKLKRREQQRRYYERNRWKELMRARENYQKKKRENMPGLAGK